MAAPASPRRKAAAAGDIMVFMDGDGADDPAASRRWSSRSAPAGSISSSARARAASARPAASPGIRSPPGMMAGYGMRLLYGVRYTDMCAFRAIPRDRLLDARHAGTDLRLEYRDADARGPRRAAHSRNSGSVPLQDRRGIQGRRQSARDNSRRNAHHQHLRPGFGTTGAGTGRLALMGVCPAV